MDDDFINIFKYIFYLFTIYVFITQFKPIKSEQESLRLPVFLFFFATEFSRAFFPMFVESFHVDHLSKNSMVAYPQIAWGVMTLIGTSMGFSCLKKYGERNMFILTMLIAAISISIMAVTSNYYLMLFLRSLHALCVGVFSYVAVVFLSKSIKDFGIFLGGIAAGAICAAVLGGKLATQFGYTSTLHVSALIALAGVLFVYLNFNPSLHKIKDIKKLTIYEYFYNMKSIRIHLFAILMCVPSKAILTGFILYLLPVYLHEINYNYEQIGYVMMVYFSCNYLFVKPINWILFRTKAYKSAGLISNMIMATALFLFFEKQSNFLIVFSMVLFSIGMTLANATQIPLIFSLFPKKMEELGKEALISFFKIAERMAMILGTIITSFLIAYKMYDLLFIGMLIVASLTGLWFYYENKYLFYKENAFKGVLKKQ